MTVPPSPQVVALLAGLIEERTGISYEIHHHDLFTEKLMVHAREVGFESALDYYYYLRYDPASQRELDELVDALVVTESYFFREADVLRAVRDHFVAPRVAAGARPRLWSAACASGEEPLTFAMLLDEAGLLGRVDLVASDLTLTALRRARKRGYGPRSRRAVPGDVSRWMRVEGETTYVASWLYDAIEWRRVNLVNPEEVASVGPCDVIVCRNVFIYFTDVTIQRVVGSFLDLLRPGGRVVVGAAESLLRFGTMLACEERGGAFFYRRAA